MVQQPRARDVGQRLRQERQHGGTQYGAQKCIHAADVGEQHGVGGQLDLKQHVVAGFDVQGLQAARDAGEHGRQGKHHGLERVRAVAQVAQAVGVFTQAQR
ncbi:hypothetical protein D3C72_2032230 [compost metagenome]